MIPSDAPPHVFMDDGTGCRRCLRPGTFELYGPHSYRIPGMSCDDYEALFHVRGEGWFLAWEDADAYDPLYLGLDSDEGPRMWTYAHRVDPAVALAWLRQLPQFGPIPHGLLEDAYGSYLPALDPDSPVVAAEPVHDVVVEEVVGAEGPPKDALPAVPDAPPDAEEEQATPPWSEEDLGELGVKVQRLIRHMRRHGPVSHADRVCPAVWDKPYFTVGEAAVKGVVSRANGFLGKYLASISFSKVNQEFTFEDAPAVTGDAPGASR